jgi:periplasmic protein TonB
VTSRLGLVAVSLWIAGCGGSSGPTTPSAPEPVVVYEVGNGVSAPTVLKEVKPNYTREAVIARIQGSVLLLVVVLRDGTVGDVTVTKSLDPGLDAESVNAAKQWLFNPGLKDGVPVAVRVMIQFTFTIANP